jgi:ribosomal protein L5
MMARLKQVYREKVIPDLMKKFGYKTQMQVPRIEKITLNMGVGEAVQDKKILEHAVGDLTKIAGQKPVVTKAKKSIATFKVRKDYPVGCMVTLRGTRMYEWRSQEFAIFGGFPVGPLMDAAIIPWAFVNRSFFLKSNTTRSMHSGD